MPRDDAYFMSVKLKHMSSARLWFGDRVAAELKTPLHVHAVCIAHLSDDPHAEMVDPFDIIRFSVPQSTLNQFIDDMGAKPIEGLQFPVPGTVDPIFGHLASCLLPALENPAHSSPLFVETITRAVSAHVLNKYGNVRFAESRAIRGGLAHWQERRVREMIDTHLDGSVTIAMLAAECGMSSGHFSHAFKRQVGQSPYQYLISQRLLRAKTLMLTTQLPLVEIAVACGFSTQTHFNKRFLAANGISPGVWRRLNATRKNVGNRD
ncbi:helix-turn-helix domain-containing protein [Paraburkholderia sp. GAS199]|uniref:helix-turn-helix domain-containing protein n=1 Tax=Paraburkholderia sp. GAS199 TaxID=3035126 RepID=UPI003D21816C